MIENAIIKSTKLGYEDHHIFTCQLFIEGSSWGCSFGGYALIGRDGAETFDVIAKMLDTFEVDNWEDLSGKLIRVEYDRLCHPIKRIGHIMKDKWFSFQEYFDSKNSTF